MEFDFDPDDPTYFDDEHGFDGEHGFADEDDYDEDDVFIRTCGRCGTRTSPQWSESASLEEARRYGWRRVAASDRPGSRRMDLCGRCASEAGYGAPLARWGSW